MTSEMNCKIEPKSIGLSEQSTRADKTQLALWEIKEAAWQLYGGLGWKPEVYELVKRIEADVNTTMRRLGYDPTYICKGGRQW